MWHKYKKFSANLLLLTVLLGLLVLPISSVAWVKPLNKNVLSIKHKRQITPQENPVIVKEVRVKQIKKVTEVEGIQSARTAPGDSIDITNEELEGLHYLETQENIYPSTFERY